MVFGLTARVLKAVPGKLLHTISAWEQLLSSSISKKKSDLFYNFQRRHWDVKITRDYLWARCRRIKGVVKGGCTSPSNKKDQITTHRHSKNDLLALNPWESYMSSRRLRVKSWRPPAPAAVNVCTRSNTLNSDCSTLLSWWRWPLSTWMFEYFVSTVTFVLVMAEVKWQTLAWRRSVLTSSAACLLLAIRARCIMPGTLKG